MERSETENPNHTTRPKKNLYNLIRTSFVKANTGKYIVNKSIALKSEPTSSYSTLPFKIWALKWLETYKKDKVKDNTYKFTYVNYVENYLIPYFENTKLTDIKQIDIQNYFNKVMNPKTKEKLSFSVLNRQKAILKSIFDTAINNDICFKNPVKDIVLYNISPKKKRPVYTMDQANKLEEFALSEGKYDVILLLNTGMRRSELLGLKWTDIDFENKFIHIQRAVTQTTGKIVIDKPKSEQSDRFIPISNKIINILNLMKNDYVYVIHGNSYNEPASPHSYKGKFARFMNKANKELGIPKLTPHELRHTFGTLLREKDVDIYTIQKVMGHSDISITADIYVHNDLNVLRKKLKID